MTKDLKIVTKNKKKTLENEKIKLTILPIGFVRELLIKGV